MPKPDRRNLPDDGTPHSIQIRIAREQNDLLRRGYNKMARLLWQAVHQAGGRIEMSLDDYRTAQALSDEDSIVSVELDAKERKVALIFTDKDGKRLPESEPKLVVATDAQ